MKDFYEFGCTPSDEDCVQVSTKVDYMPAMRAEAKRMIGICNILWPNVDFRVYSEPHDFGSYLTLRVIFNSDDEEMWNILNQIDHEWPSTWEECNQRIANLNKGGEAL